MKFTDLGLSERVLAAVAQSGYTDPTPIQAQAIPEVLAKRDVIGIAQTGTGKTASFVLPMLTRLETGRARARMPRTLILEPTRELAAQVEQNFNTYGVNHKLTVALLIGGVSFDEQEKKLDRGADVATGQRSRSRSLDEIDEVDVARFAIAVVGGVIHRKRSPQERVGSAGDSKHGKLARQNRLRDGGLFDANAIDAFADATILDDGSAATNEAQTVPPSEW